jgi:hypothetical protein
MAKKETRELPEQLEWEQLEIAKDCFIERGMPRLGGVIGRAQLAITELRADKAELWGVLKAVLTAQAFGELYYLSSDGCGYEAMLAVDAVVTKHAPIPPIVQELERADELDAIEAVTISNLESCDAGNVGPVVPLAGLIAADAAKIKAGCDASITKMKAEFGQQVSDSVQDFMTKFDAMFSEPWQQAIEWSPTLTLDFGESDMTADLLEKLAPFKSWGDVGICVEVLATVATVKLDDDTFAERYELDDWRLVDPGIYFDPGVDLSMIIELLHEFVEERTVMEPVEHDDHADEQHEYEKDQEQLAEEEHRRNMGEAYGDG